MDPSKEQDRLHPNREDIPTKEVPAPSPKLDAMPRAPKHLWWGWVVLLVVVSSIALLSWWR